MLQQEHRVHFQSTVTNLYAQRGFLGAPFEQIPDELYAQVEYGHAAQNRHELTAGPHSRVSSNTYFGRFPASYWQRWTAAEQVVLEATVSGAGKLSVLASDLRGVARTVETVRVADGDGQRVALPARLDRFVDGGALWLELETQGDSLSVRDVSWSVPAPARFRPTSVVICTFNRPDDCTTTLDVLARDEECMKVVEAVYVIDQGTDTVEAHPDFPHLSALLGPKLHYHRQANLGGAGGFTRGLYEITGDSGDEHANVLFMDDDILLEPDVVLRLTAFANRTTEPVIVGAQLLYLLHPRECFGWAQTADLPKLAAGIPVPRMTRNAARTDVTRTRQEQRVDASYNAWWSCLIPSEVVARTGYPLPLFFRWDDVEYGYRARARGFATVTLAGTGVWHADWDWKDEDGVANYFGLRNSLIVNALHADTDPKQLARVMRWHLLRYLVSMRYALAATTTRAIEEFLAGPGCLHDGGAEAAASVAKLRAEYPETQCHPASDVPGLRSTAMRLTPPPPRPSRDRLVMAKRLVWQLLGKARGSAAVPSRDAHWWHVSRYATVVVSDASQGGVRVRRVDRSELIGLGRRAARALRRLRREGRAAQQAYRSALPELTTRQNWERLFERD